MKSSTLAELSIAPWTSPRDPQSHPQQERSIRAVKEALPGRCSRFCHQSPRPRGCLATSEPEPAPCWWALQGTKVVVTVVLSAEVSESTRPVEIGVPQRHTRDPLRMALQLLHFRLGLGELLVTSLANERTAPFCCKWKGVRSLGRCLCGLGKWIPSRCHSCQTVESVESTKPSNRVRNPGVPFAPAQPLSGPAKQCLCTSVIVNRYVCYVALPVTSF